MWPLRGLNGLSRRIISIIKSASDIWMMVIPRVVYLWVQIMTTVIRVSSWPWTMINLCDPLYYSRLVFKKKKRMIFLLYFVLSHAHCPVMTEISLPVIYGFVPTYLIHRSFYNGKFIISNVIARCKMVGLYYVMSFSWNQRYLHSIWSP